MSAGEKWLMALILSAVILTLVFGLKESFQKEMRRQEAEAACAGYIVEIKGNSGFFCVLDPNVTKFKESK